MTKWIVPCVGIALLATLGCSTMMGPGGEDLSRSVDYLRQDVQALTKQQKQLADEVAALRAERTPEPLPAPSPTPAKEPEESVESPTLQVTNLPSSPASLYKKAFGLMGKKRYAEAEADFARFIRLYPQSELADNSQYWLGECLYAEGNLEEASQAFQAVTDHFPFGNKVPDAMYKQAVCEEKLGHAAKAAAVKAKLLEYYPTSRAAAKAKAADSRP